MQTVRNRFPVHPKKSLGQNFLIDSNIARKIIDSADVKPNEWIVEIGPGMGILTHILVKKGAKVIAIEIDPALYGFLRETFPSSPHLELILGDACRYPYETIERPFRVIANLPYNITTPLLFRLLMETDQLTEMILMVQKEVADRLVAPVGSKQYGALSVLLGVVSKVEMLLTVSPNCFRPRPKVSSAVIRVTPHCTPMALDDRPFFARMVKGAFGHRRKFLMNALVDAGFAREALDVAFKKIGITPDRRAETLSIQEFASLANELCTTFLGQISDEDKMEDTMGPSSRPISAR